MLKSQTDVINPSLSIYYVPIPIVPVPVAVAGVGVVRGEAVGDCAAVDAAIPDVVEADVPACVDGDGGVGCVTTNNK